MFWLPTRERNPCSVAREACLFLMFLKRTIPLNTQRGSSTYSEFSTACPKYPPASAPPPSPKTLSDVVRDVALRLGKVRLILRGVFYMLLQANWADPIWDFSPNVCAVQRARHGLGYARVYMLV